MTASMLLEVLLAADGSAIDRAGKMDCARGGTATRVLSMGTGAGSEKGCSVNQAFCSAYALEDGVRFPPATTARFHYFSQEASRGG